MKTLNQKVVVITGAGSGIGRALAISAAERGASIAISDWNQEGLEETAKLTGASPGRILVRQVDVRSDDAVNDFAATVEREIGKFLERTRADEIIVSGATFDPAARRRSLELTAKVFAQGA